MKEDNLYKLIITLWGEDNPDIDYGEIYNGFIPRFRELYELGKFPMSTREYEVFMYHYVDELNNIDIAKIMGISVSRVAQLLSKTKLKLRHGSCLKYLEEKDLLKVEQEYEHKARELKIELDEMIQKNLKAKELVQNDDIKALRDLLDMTNLGNAREIPLRDCGFSIRTFNCLRRFGIKYLNDLTKYSYEDMMHVRNLGMKGLKEIVRKMINCNLSFTDYSTLSDMKRIVYYREEIEKCSE